jgi:Flp pilus assembly protein TadB
MMKVLWTTPLGVKLLWAAGIGIIIGGLIIHKIVNMDV